MNPLKLCVSQACGVPAVVVRAVDCCQWRSGHYSHQSFLFLHFLSFFHPFSAVTFSQIGFFSDIIILWRSDQSLILFKYSCDFKFSGFIYWPCVGISDGTWSLVLNEESPIVIRLIISNVLRSSTNLSLTTSFMHRLFTSPASNRTLLGLLTPLKTWQKL